MNLKSQCRDLKASVMVALRLITSLQFKVANQNKNIQLSSLLPLTLLVLILCLTGVCKAGRDVLTPK